MDVFVTQSDTYAIKETTRFLGEPPGCGIFHRGWYGWCYHGHNLGGGASMVTCGAIPIKLATSLELHGLSRIFSMELVFSYGSKIAFLEAVRFGWDFGVQLLPIFGAQLLKAGTVRRWSDPPTGPGSSSWKERLRLWYPTDNGPRLENRLWLLYVSRTIIHLWRIWLCKH